MAGAKFDRDGQGVREGLYMGNCSINIRDGWELESTLELTNFNY